MSWIEFERGKRSIFDNQVIHNKLIPFFMYAKLGRADSNKLSTLKAQYSRLHKFGNYELSISILWIQKKWIFIWISILNI